MDRRTIALHLSWKRNGQYFFMVMIGKISVGKMFVALHPR